jgi:hypothetical protein
MDTETTATDVADCDDPSSGVGKSGQGELAESHITDNPSHPTVLERPRRKKKRRWRKNFQVAASVVTNILTLVALFFVWQQNQQLAQQTGVASTQLQSSGAAGEMQFNLQVMERLDDTLMMIAENSDCFGYVWSDVVASPVPNSKPVQCGDSLIDILSMALKGLNRFPCFSQNNQDWQSYTRYVMDESISLRSRVLSNPIWWPEVTPYAKDASDGTPLVLPPSRSPQVCK